MATDQLSASNEVNQEVLAALVSAGLGDLRVPSSRSEWEALPMHQQAQISHVVPAFAESFADVAGLPAGTRLRLELGQLELGDMSALAAAGFLQTARELKTRSKAKALAEFSARMDERMASIQAARRQAQQGSEAAARASLQLAYQKQRAATMARQGW